MCKAQASTYSQVKKQCWNGITILIVQKKEGSNPNDYGWGALFTSIAKYKDQWDKLPK